MRGCDSCGGRFFFHVNQKQFEKQQELDSIRLGQRQMKEIESDIRDIVGAEDETVVLDVEAIRVIGPGKYEIDVTNLFNQKPLVIKLAPGKYELDLSVLRTNKDS